MTNVSKAVLGVALVMGTFLVLLHADRALKAALPANMPADSQFLQSGFQVKDNETQGNWVACRVNESEGTDWCRVTDQVGNVVYQGNYLPLGSSVPLNASSLRIRSISPDKIWVSSPVQGLTVPVFPLEGGQILVPAEDSYPLAERWKVDPTEYNRLIH